MNDIQKSQLSQSLTNEEPLDEKSNEQSCCEKISYYLRFFSFGKYHTPLYYQRSDLFSSVFSGILSNFFFLGMIVVALITFIPIFQRRSYALDVKSLDTEKLIQVIKDEEVFYKLYTCPECVRFTLEEALYMFNETSYIIDTESYNNTFMSCE